MTLAASILLGFPLGLWLMFRRRTQVIFGVVWLAILAFQTWDIAFDPAAPNRGVQTKWYYWVGQPVIFAVGVTLSDSTDGGTAVSWVWGSKITSEAHSPWLSA